MRSFVDTNVLVYAVDEVDARRRAIARELLAAGVEGGLVVSTQVLSGILVAGFLVLGLVMWIVDRVRSRA